MATNVINQLHYYRRRLSEIVVALVLLVPLPLVVVPCIIPQMTVEGRPNVTPFLSDHQPPLADYHRPFYTPPQRLRSPLGLPPQLLDWPPILPVTTVTVVWQQPQVQPMEWV